MAQVKYGIEGIEERGMTKGLIKGRLKGRPEGREKEREEIAWKLIQQNIDKEAIRKATGLTNEQIFKIERKLGKGE